ncbi:ester cyclase [Sinomonas mesophila]|uniref:ester cyclase n=1 Tax=Sinomonas mesophila TaxID=1531955 RepID=UPI000986895C|nr:ester cyclase [Sinomonas mesophila]
MSVGSGLMHRFYADVLVGGDLALIDELVTDDFVDHEEPLPGQPPGKEGVRFYINAVRSAFSDLKIETTEPALTDGNLECVHGIISGTHTGEFAGIPSTGRRVEFAGIDIIRVQDGKVAEHWGVTDTLKIMQQIGAIPE